MRFRRFASYLALVLVLSIAVGLAPQPALAAPSISVSLRSGAPGTRLTVHAANFTSYAGDSLAVFFGETQVGRIAVPPLGDFQAQFAVPDTAAPGEATISIRSAAEVTLAEALFTVPAPELRLNAYGGSVGTKVLVKGRGLHANSTVTFWYVFGEGADVLGTVVAGDTGECSLTVEVPASPQGRHVIYADDGKGHSPSVEFEIIPSVQISPASAAVGDKVAVMGLGFKPADEVSVAIKGEKVAYGITQARGTFTAQFFVPVLTAGTYLVAIEDFNKELRWVDLVIVPRISLSKAAGEVGARLTLTGTGYEVRSPVIMKYDAQTLTAVVTDDTGAFTMVFTVPVSNGGVHVVTATDFTNTEQVFYNVEEEAPVPPEPLTPRPSTEVTAPVTFDWENVYDVSQPLVYSFQIARTDDFLRPILERHELTASSQIVSAEELLPNRRGTFYYWRARAVDGASNAGEWSEPVPFRLKPADPLPGWARWVLILVQVAIAALYAVELRWELKHSKPRQGEETGA